VVSTAGTVVIIDEGIVSLDVCFVAGPSDHDTVVTLLLACNIWDVVIERPAVFDEGCDADSEELGADGFGVEAAASLV
jgi:hypothetical protein